MKDKNYIPDIGDIVYVDFDPAKGHEQKGRRPGLVISNVKYNKVFGLFLVVPITSHIKGYPFEVLLENTKKIKGVVLSDQIKSFDMEKRSIKFVESVSKKISSQVLERINTILTV